MDTPAAGGWKENLEGVLASSRRRSPTELINRIRDLGLVMGHDAGEAVLNAHPELLRHQPELTAAFREIIAAQDITEVEQLLAYQPNGRGSFRDAASRKTDIGVMSSLEAYNRLDHIFDRIDFRSFRRAVVVGCGRRPFTMFRIHDRTAIPEIVGLDVVLEAVVKANELAAKFGYDRMRAELCDGCQYDYGQADIVYVTSMVTPKARVVSRIADTAREDVQVILWEPCSLARLWMESAERELDPRFEVVGRSDIWRNMTRDVFVRFRHGPHRRELDA